MLAVIVRLLLGAVAAHCHAAPAPPVSLGVIRKQSFLAVWGKNDPFFLPPGAEAFKRDIPEAEIYFFDTGHFALETHAAEIATKIRDFLGA